MSTVQTAPGGMTWSSFKATCADVGSWTWGTVQGAFNEKASFSQIVVDAVIGMIPLVGDVTAVRDIIAVVIGLIDDPKKREDVWEWVLLVVLVVALIPVVGGVIKGVGRILCKVFKHASKLTGAARAAHLAEGAREIVAFLNRIGMKNAEKWLLTLRFADYQPQIMERFAALMNTLSSTLRHIRAKAGNMVHAGLVRRIEALQNGIAQLKAAGNKMIPLAVKELDQNLREIQAYVRSGGEATSRTTLHRVATGERVVTRADEARLIEQGALPMRSARGGWKQNEALIDKPSSWKKLYKHEPGYPDLTKRSAKPDSYSDIEAFSGRITNRPLKAGEKIYRFFGPGGTTHGTTINQSFPGGNWWGLGEPPKSAKEWRLPCAVLDEFNRDGFMVVATVPPKISIKAAVGTVSEQAGKNIAGQFLPGGAIQAVIEFGQAGKATLAAKAQEVIATGKPAKWLDPASGLMFDIKPTGWKDANGIWGYVRTPGPATIQTARLGTREMATKKSREVVVTP